MACLIRTLQRAHSWKWNCSSLRNNGLSGTLLGLGSRAYAAEAVIKSPFESNILRILRNEIEYQYEYAPPQQVYGKPETIISLLFEGNVLEKYLHAPAAPPAGYTPYLPETKFNSFTVDERPGEQVVTIRGKYGDTEDITIEATMFDGYAHVPVVDSSAMGVRLHLSLLVDISKRDGGNELEFICSAWPDCLDIEKVYILRRRQMPARPYLGPDFRNLNAEVQEKFRQYLDARGVNNELSAFLHDYVMNKDRIELLRWMDRLKSFVEK